MPEITFMPFHDEMERINGRMECHWSMIGALDDIRTCICRSRFSKSRKAELMAQLDHMESHISGEVRVLCNDARDRQN